MNITLAQLAHLTPAMARSLMPQWLGTFVVVAPEYEAQMIAQVDDLLSQSTDEEIAAALSHMATFGDGYELYPAQPLARSMTRLYMGALMHEATLTGLEHLRAASARGPVLLMSNHLAYCDTQVKDLLLLRAGAEDVAESIVAVAGPKVYGTVFRRMASAGLSTLKTAQSSGMATNAAGLSPREVAQIALQTVGRARDLMTAGRLVLIYGEGSRSRDGSLQPFLRAVRKYAAVPGLQIVPMAISGTNRMMPIGQVEMVGTPVQLRIGEAVTVETAGRTEAIEETWHRISGMLPEENRPQDTVKPIV
jgi:1-acyl-sn-glycerol-3-phosphate acyltransferase